MRCRVALLFLAYALLFDAPTAIAQEELFKLDPVGQLRNKYPALDQILRLPTTDDAGVGTLSVDLTKSDSIVTFKYGTSSTRFKPTSWRKTGAGFSWSAVGADSGWEAACLLLSGATTRGVIYTRAGVFSIEPVGDDMHAVVRFNPRKLPDEGPPVQRTTRASVSSDAPGRRASPVQVQVLVAFAKDAARAHATAAARRAWLDDVINVTNCSYAISGVDVELVASPSSPYLVDYRETGFTTDLNLLMGKNDGVMEDIHTVRENDKADLVVLITNKRNALCGRAATTEATKRSAFAFVRLDCAKEKLTFAHEIGHLQGASHQDETGKYDYGHGFCKDGRGTVMSAGCGVRHPIWSHPPNLGSEAREDNVRVLNYTAETIGGLLN
jgi:hypothetical protein